MAQRELDALEEGVTVGWEGTEAWKTGHYWLLVTQIFLLVLNYMVDILERERREADLVIRVTHSQERSQELREEEEVTQEPALTQVRDWHEH